VGFAVQHAIALLDHGVSDGLGQVTLTGPGEPRNMMHITLVWQQSTTVGIRFMGSRYEFSSGGRTATASTSSVNFPTAPFVPFRHGCLVQIAPAFRRDLL
jgi:hypothetical protein